MTVHEPVRTPLGATLREVAAAQPDRPAVTCAGTTLTRAQFSARVDAVAALFADLGVKDGSVVTIGLPNSIAFLEATFATWALGATPQPISHRLPAAEAAAIVELADPALVVGLPGAAGTGRATLESIPDDLAQWSDTPIEPGIAEVWRIATSGGSTGRPKLIVSDMAACTENISGSARLFRLPRDGTMLMTAPLSHAAPFVISVLGLLRGDHVVIQPRFEAAETLRLVAEHRVGWLYVVPTMMQRIWRLPEAEREAHDVASLEVVLHMAAPCPAWLKRAWIDWLGPDVIIEVYGGSELQSMTVVTGREWLEHPGSVGRPAFGEMEARSPQGRRLGPMEVGEIWMRRGKGASNSYHYIGATPRAAADGWESLGDLGYLDADGFVYLTDRDTDMILVGGANVYPAEVEAAIDEHPAVRSSCVIGLPHPDLGDVPHALVELATPVSDAQLLEHLRERLAGYKLPRSVERVSEPLRDDAGKVRRSALRAARLVDRADGQSQSG